VGRAARLSGFAVVFHLRGDEIEARLAAGADRFVELRHPGAVLAIGHFLDRLAETLHPIGVASPAMRPPKKPEDRTPIVPLEAGNRKVRQQIVAGGDTHDEGIENAVGDTPFHGDLPHRLSAADSGVEQHVWIARLDTKAFG
jgi:hypothetical protein